ncbi:MAG: DNA repair exonuclease [bacterium]
MIERNMVDNTLTFIHTADCHLDAPLTGLRLIDDAMAEQIAAGQRETFISIIDLCIAKRADFLVIAGDLFDTSQKNLNTQVVLKKQFEKLRKNGIEVYIAAGNHDNLEETDYHGAGLEITLPDNVHVFSGDGPQEIIFHKNGAPAARLVGMSFPKRDIQNNLAGLFPAKSGALFTVGVLHTSVGGGSSEHVNYAPCSAGDLESKGYDYWALGHIHQRIVLRERPYIVYPGCPQARRRRETGRMSVTLVQTGPAGAVNVSELPTGDLQMEDIPIDISDINENAYGDLVSLIKTEFDALRSGLAPHVACCIARIRFTGEGSMFSLKYDPYIEQHKKNAFEYIKEALIQLDSGARPSILIREIDASACEPAKESLDISALRSEDSVMGETVRYFDSIKTNPEKLAGFTGALLENSLNHKLGNDSRVSRQLQKASIEYPGAEAADSYESLLDDALMICLDSLRADRK